MRDAVDRLRGHRLDGLLGRLVRIVEELLLAGSRTSPVDPGSVRQTKHARIQAVHPLVT